MASLKDLLETITISKAEYKALVKERERLDILKNFVKNGKYTTMDDIKSILGVEEKAGDQNSGN